MADYLDEAYRAITRVLEVRQRQDAPNWRSITPSKEWGILPEKWAYYLRDFRAAFLEEIAPKQIKAGERFLGYRVKPLRELQRRMSDTVDVGP